MEADAIHGQRGSPHHGRWMLQVGKSIESRDGRDGVRGPESAASIAVRGPGLRLTTVGVGVFGGEGKWPKLGTALQEGARVKPTEWSCISTNR